LLEREQAAELALPPWALDPTRGECTTLTLLAPVPTQFVVRFHPWPGLPSALASSAGAFQVTRCGTARMALMQVTVEMRSPRAVLHPLVAIGAAAPPLLETMLPTRDTGPSAAEAATVTARQREPLAERLRRFETKATLDGGRAFEALPLRPGKPERLALGVGCHRLLASMAEPGAFRLLLRDASEREPRRLEATEGADVSQELCFARERSLLVEVEVLDGKGEVTLASASFPLPKGLPGRFGPQIAERLTETVGASSAPGQLGLLVSSSLGAQGHTHLPRELPPGSCYLAAVLPLHGEPSSLALGVSAGAWSGEAASTAAGLGSKLGFCVDRTGQVDLDVEARGLGLAWLLLLFRAAPAEVAAGSEVKP
jgi:hypothetical protein